jgi:ribosomal protein S18 acetylase RimI-like enzyme
MFYTKYHCLINKRDFVKPSELKANNLSIEKKLPNASYYKYLLTRVGSPWKWTERPKYKLYTDDLRERLENPHSRLYIFKRGEQLIGYSLVTPSKEDAVKDYKNLIEIENFGLFLEQTGKGYGNILLQKLFATLFEQYDSIYLTSRSTNHHKVIPFYQNNGMTVIKTEHLPDDLIFDDSDGYTLAA